MFIFKIGQPRICYEQPGEGAPGGTGEGAHPVEAPWTGADGMWNLGEGDAAQPWFSTIPEEDARSHVEAKGYKNPAELALANLNLTKLHRGDPTVIGLPGKDATPEQMGEFYGKLGRPDAPEGYEFQFAEGFTPDEGMMTFARTTFHEAGLTPAQAQLVADKWNEYAAKETGDLQSRIDADNDKALEELTAKWGADLDKNKEAGRRAMAALGVSAELVDKVEQSIGAASIVELLATIGRKSDEGGIINSDQGGDPNNPDTMTKAQAEAKIAEMQGDAEFQKKYTDRNHPGHKEAVDYMQRLFARA